MKKLFAVFAVLVASAVIVVACGGGGGGGGGAPAATYTTTQQAATSSAAAAGTVSTGISGLTSGAMGLSNTVMGQAGRAKRLARVEKLSQKGASSLDPRTQTLVKRMRGIMQSPMVKKAVAKAKAAKAMKRATFPGVQQPCASGYYTLTGTDNYDDQAATNDIWNVTLTFSNCRDTDNSTYWNEINGTINDQFNAPRNQSALSGNETYSTTITNLVMKDYSGGFTGPVMWSDTLHGTFGGSWTWNETTTAGSWSGSDTANATYTMVFTDPSVTASSYKMTMAMTGLTDSASGNWSDAAGTDSWTDTLGGSYKIGFVDNANTNLFSFEIAFSGLQDKGTDYWDNLGNYLRYENWLNGSLSFTWTPAIDGLGCLNGGFVFATPAANPITTLAGNTCPTSGELSINNAKIVFNADQSATLSVGADTQTFPTCNDLELAGGACAMTM